MTLPSAIPPAAYRPDSVEGGFLAGRAEAVGKVSRWISVVLASPRYWRLRGEWLDLHQEIMGRVVESLRRERFDAAQDFRTYVQGVARFTALASLSPRHRFGGSEELDEEDLAVEPETEEGAISRQLARLVLEEASEGCQNLLRAYFFEERNYAEISEFMSVPIGTVKSRLARCLDGAHRVLRGSRSKRGETGAG